MVSEGAILFGFKIEEGTSLKDIFDTFNKIIIEDEDQAMMILNALVNNLKASKIQ